MKGYIDNIEKETIKNDNFRKVIYTAKNCQLVLMSIRPGEEIGEEIHNLDQFFRIEKGRGVAVISGRETKIEDGIAIIIPAGVSHNIKNIDKKDSLKLYTIYTPPEHKDGVIHKDKIDAISDKNDHFDGKISE